MNPTSEEVTCAYVNEPARCPGLEETLPHCSQGGLSHRALAFHVAKCPACLAATVRCLRAGCPVAGLPFVGVNALVPLNGRWDGLLRTWCNDVFKGLAWTAFLPEVDAEDFREDAIVHAWKLLLSDPKFDPEHIMLDRRPAGPLIKKAMDNRMKDHRRKSTVSTIDPVTGQHRLPVRIGLDDGDLDDQKQPTDGSPQLLPAVASAEDHALAIRDLDAAAAVVSQVIEDLADKPDQQYVVSEFLRRRVRGGELTQAELAKLLQRDRELRKDGSERDDPPNQATISRWINRSRLAIAAMLGDPKRGISPSTRNAVLNLIAPAKHADTTTSPEAKR